MATNRGLGCLIAVMGCTGVGKSRLAIELAERFCGEMISADSMQVYQGLDVVTNKVTAEERLRAPHHMIDIVGPREEYTVTQYRDAVLKLVNEIVGRGRVPILCGGTCYYVDAIICQAMLENATIQHQEALSGESSAEECKSSNPNDDWAMLQKVDPVMAGRLHPNDHRKIRRALEVYRTTNTPYSVWVGRQRGSGASARFRYPRTLLLWVDSEFSSLDPRLDARVDDMLAGGALSEMYDVWSALPHGQDGTPDFTRGILQNIGFKELYPYFQARKDAGLIGPPPTPPTSGTTAPPTSNCPDFEGKLLKLYREGVDQMKSATRRYSRKQQAWLRNRFAPTVLEVRQELQERKSGPENTELLVSGDGDGQQPSKRAKYEDEDTGKHDIKHVEPDTGDQKQDTNGEKEARDVFLYVLNATDISKWEKDVCEKACNVVDVFLSGGQVPNQETFGNPSPSLLEQLMESVNRKTGEKTEWKKYFCEKCDRTLNGENEWKVHLKSKGHRKRKVPTSG